MITLEQRNAKLDEAKALVLAGWCQGSYAQDKNGRPVIMDRDKDSDCRFCAQGAMLKVTNYEELRPVNAAMIMTLKILGFGDNVAAYNDAPGRTKYEVATLFDLAKEQPL